MFQIMKNAWKITELRNKILFTILIVAIFRAGSAISVPFIDVAALNTAVSAAQNDWMGFLTLMSGGGFSNASIFALSITPYINASIIIQLLTVAIPALEQMSKDGEEGRKKLAQITRYATVILSLLLGVAYYFMVRNNYGAIAKYAQSGFAGVFAAIVIVLCFTAGSTLVMWLGEQINKNGIGNGISILLFAGILSSLPTGLINLWDIFMQGVSALQQGYTDGLTYVILVPVVLVLFVAIMMFIVFITDAERRIPVQYAKRVVGRKMYGGQSTYIPIKVNMSGVMPIILASSIIQLPSIITTFTGQPKEGFWLAFLNCFRQDSLVYVVLYFFMIIGFAFFYVTIQYNPVEMANNLRKNSGSIPGIRPGKPTSDFIQKVLSRITLLGALFLSVVAVGPIIFGLFNDTFASISVGGTSVLIIVGVALEIVSNLESQMMMRHYKGFLD